MADPRDARLGALRERMTAAGLDALLVSHLPNIRYLTGFSGTAGLLLVDQARVVLITDFRYEVQAAQEAGTRVTLAIERINSWERLRVILGEAPPASLGFEAEHLVTRDAERLTTLSTARVEGRTDLVEGLRLSKSPEEVAAIRRAGVLALEALAEVLPAIHPGMSEFAVAAELEAALRRRGSEWHPFPSIVASGPRSALPHARTSGRLIEAGDLLLLDFGAQVDGYCADITRTVVVGAPATARQREVYEVVRAAQARALAGIRVGQSGREADALARDVIAEAGFGAHFGHSLGHGLGLEVHEAPRLSPTTDLPIPGGVVVTIEPGIYLPGWGGVRLEDDVHLEPDGPVLLTDGRTELVELL